VAPTPGLKYKTVDPIKKGGEVGVEVESKNIHLDGCDFSSEWLKQGGSNKNIN